MHSFQLATAAIRKTAKNLRLIALLWIAQLAIAAIAGYPVFRYLDSALSHSPAGDEFLHRFSLPLVSDLARAGASQGIPLGSLLTLVIVLTLLWNAGAAGGALETLLSNDPVSTLHRFARGAGRYFNRFLRMGLVAAATAIVIAAVLSGPVFAVSGALDDAAEGAKQWLNFAGVLLALLAVLTVLLALDLARTRVARDDRRKGVAVFFATLRALLRRPLLVLGLWFWLAAAFAALALLYSALCHVLPTGAGLALFAVVVLQQLLAMARAGMRVALWSGEIAIVDRRSPEPPLSKRLAAAQSPR
ncbi:MAG: hypothetical protein ABI639_05725 [Thermoanaerobaculia bacterium]